MTAHKVERAYKKLQYEILEKGAPECVNYPEIFFPEDFPGYYSKSPNWEQSFAKKLCGFCPLKELCAEYALLAHEPYGIWGGMTANERADLLKKSRRKR